MLTITSKQMKAMDQYAINNIGIPSIVLMENAAIKVVQNIHLKNTHSYTLVCGTGNNGGDGLAIARHLILKGKKIDLFIVGNLHKASKDFSINLNILKNMHISYTHILYENDLKTLEKSLKENQLTIDAIFGIGITRDVEGMFFQTIYTMNTCSEKILSIDLPSGLDADTGKILGISIKANTTITFHHMKKGLLINKDSSEKILIEDIGIPEIATKIVLSMK